MPTGPTGSASVRRSTVPKSERLVVRPKKAIRARRAPGRRDSPEGCNTERRPRCVQPPQTGHRRVGSASIRFRERVRDVPVDAVDAAAHPRDPEPVGRCPPVRVGQELIARPPDPDHLVFATQGREAYEWNPAPVVRSGGAAPPRPPAAAAGGVGRGPSSRPWLRCCARPTHPSRWHAVHQHCPWEARTCRLALSAWSSRVQGVRLKLCDSALPTASPSPPITRRKFPRWA